MSNQVHRLSTPAKLVVLDHIQNFVASHVDCTLLYFTALAVNIQILTAFNECSNDSGKFLFISGRNLRIRLTQDEIGSCEFVS